MIVQTILKLRFDTIQRGIRKGKYNYIVRDMVLTTANATI